MVPGIQRPSPKLFESLAIKCDGSHTHASWGVWKTHGSWKFDTADEAVYPKLLVQRMVQCVVRQLPPELYNALGEFRLEVLQQTGVQDKHHPSLISEYASIEWLPEVPQAPPSKILQTPWPAGEMNEGGNDKSDNTEGNQLFKIGFYFSPEEYVRRAMRLEHPASQFHLVPDSLRMNIFLL